MFSFRLVLLAVWASMIVNAQVSTGTITGVLTDPSESRIPNVPIRLTSEDTGVVQTSATNSAGEYTFPLLQSGRYQLTAEGTGFRPHTQSGIVVEIGRTVRLDIVMQLGQVAEAVNVTSSAPLLQSESSTVDQFIENKTIADMPLNGRRVGDLLGLMGNAIYIRGDVIRPRVAIAGGRGDQQQWMLDGVNASNIALEVPQALFNPPVESVQEIRVQQNAYSAEFGNSSSGVITMTTRSGSNRFTGTAYEYFRNDKLDARNFFAANKAPLRWNVFGFAVGGPVIRNRTFFFNSTEWQKQRIGNTRVLTVPTAAERAGDFSRTVDANGRLLQVYDPATSRPNPANPAATIRDPFPGNIVPANRLDPVGRNIAALFPLPNRPATNLAGANNFVGNNVQALNIVTSTTKVDHVISDHDRLSGRFILHDFPTSDSAVFPDAGADPFAASSDRRAYSLLLNEIHQFTATLVNDFRFNWQPRRFHNMSAGLGEGWPTKLGLQGVSDRAFPRVNPTGYTSLGIGTHERIQMPIHDTHLVDAMSWFRGKHSLKFGGEIRLARNVDDFDQQISGVLGFNSTSTSMPGVNGTGNAVASMLLGLPVSGNVRETDILDRRSKYFALFAQEDWKATTNLTINLGFRWETHTPRFDANDRQSGFDRFAINPVSGTPGVVTFANRDGYGRQLYNSDYNNVMPRIGLAWKPFGWRSTVVRTGYGIFYGPPQPGSNTASAGFETSGSFTSPDNGITPAFILRDGFPSTARPALGPGYGAVRVGQAAIYSPDFIDVNRQLGYTQQWNFGIQRELAWSTVTEITYLGNIGHKLNGPDTSINQVPRELMGAGNAQVRRPFPQFANVVTIAPMWGNSSYHSLNLKMEKRFSHGLNFLANYTFAKFIDDVPASQEAGVVGGGIQDLYNRRAEKSLSGNDVRHRFVWSSVYELPVGRGRRWMGSGIASTLFGGWNLGGILTLQGGHPFGLITQQNTTNAFNPGSQRVNVLRDPKLPESERRVERYFDTEAVAAPAPFTFGNSGRALLTGPGVFNLDMSLLKNHRWGETYNIQFRFETFNLLNHANFEEPGRSLGAPGFGVISAARDGRSLQFGLKFLF